MGKPLGKWHGPVTVELGPSLCPEQRRALCCAVDWWNHRFSNLFFLRDGTKETDVGWPPREGIASATSHVPSGGPNVRATTEVFYKRSVLEPEVIIAAHIEIRPGIDGDIGERACAHELGHVLGLGHTRSPKGHLMGLHAPGWLLLEDEIDFVLKLRS